MVYTITFNPALDYIINVDDFNEGVVNRTSAEKLLPGGKGINVSWVLKNLGVENVSLGFLSGFTGEIIKNMLDNEGVANDFIFLKSGFSRINVKIKSEKETEINGMGPEIDGEELAELYKKLNDLKDGDFLVLAGSVPKCMKKDIYCEILECVKEKKVKTIVDATGDFLTNTLKYKPFLIKPNNFELEEIFGRKLENDSDITECAKKLQDMGALNVLVSMGGDGAILITEDGDTLKSKVPEGKVINTTGSGDSMVAGFIAGICEKEDFEYALKLGIASGSASAFSENLAIASCQMSHLSVVSKSHLPRGIYESFSVTRMMRAEIASISFANSTSSLAEGHSSVAGI